MSKKGRLSHDQKRKAKLAKEARQARPQVSLAYEGNKYKTAELMPVFFSTELGIYESYIMSHRQLTDSLVRSALEKLVLQMRRGPLPPLEETGTIQVTAGQEADLIIQNIRRNWKDLEPRPRADDLIGVLRTTLHSLDIWTTRSPGSRGYLHYIEGFLKKQGVSVDVVSEEGDRLPEPPEPELLQIGRAWCHDGDPEAADEFRRRAREMIRDGAAETVVEVCHRLVSELGPGTTTNELLILSLQAQTAKPSE